MRSRPARTPSFFSIERDGMSRKAFHPRQHHALAFAAEVTRVEPGRKYLAVLRDKWLSNRVFETYDAILVTLLAWNKLIDMP